VIAGATSTLGVALVGSSLGCDAVPVCNTHSQSKACRDWLRINVEDTEGWKRLVDDFQPAAWIHAAGVCNVAQCEANPAWARSINVQAVEDLLSFLPASVRLVYLSSDHVFRGREKPYIETDVPDPVSTYGRLRAEAEQSVLHTRPDALVVRPGLCLGPSLDGLRGHWDNLPRRLRSGLPVTVIDGEVRSALWAPDAAERIVNLMKTDLRGLWHLTAEACVGRVELARALCRAHSLPEEFVVQSVEALDKPHLRRVELRTRHDHSLALPLPGILERLALMG
jgi:dTDP-4-dehydrorhamnose reductase